MKFGGVGYRVRINAGTVISYNTYFLSALIQNAHTKNKYRTCQHYIFACVPHAIFICFIQLHLQQSLWSYVHGLPTSARDLTQLGFNVNQSVIFKHLFQSNKTDVTVFRLQGSSLIHLFLAICSSITNSTPQPTSSNAISAIGHLAASSLLSSTQLPLSQF